MSAQHTPGTWRYEYESGYCGEIISSNGNTVCTFADEPSAEDAPLLAAAPELLANLQIVVFHMRRKDFHDHPRLYEQAIDAIEKVIAKATGGAA